MADSLPSGRSRGSPVRRLWRTMAATLRPRAGRRLAARAQLAAARRGIQRFYTDDAPGLKMCAATPFLFF